MKFSELQLDPRLNAAIERMGYGNATPIQEQTIPHILAGRDVAGLAQTGTGKTAAFVIPLVERILKSETEPQHERAFKDWQAFQGILILVPTRELADQIHENIQKISEGCGLKSYPLYGGTGYEKQKEALKSNLHFIVSTPGRLIDLYKEHFVDFKKVRAVVFDEADRMFDMGFKDDMKYILSRIERNRQFLVFSATLNFDVLNTAYQFGAEPVEINISRDQATADNVKDFIFHLGSDEKPQHLLSLIKKESPKQLIIFTNYKNSVDRIANFLTSNGLPAMGISSLMSQAHRNNVIAQFKAENNQNILVATDVAARGLDISDVDLVVNYELPQDSESYVHRIGRTGRAGKEGKAYSFVSDKDVDSLSRIEEYTKKKINIGYMEDQDLIKDFTALSRDEYSLKGPQKSFSHSKERGERGGGRPERGGDRSDRRPAHKDRKFDKKDHPNQGKPAQGGASQGHGNQGPKAHGSSQKSHKPGSGHAHGSQKPQHQSHAKGSHAAQGAHKKPVAGSLAKPAVAASAPKKNFRQNKGSSPRKQTSHAAANKGVAGKISSFFKSLFK